MTYQLPLNDDGTANLAEVNADLLLRAKSDTLSTVEILTALAAHYEALGAEKEREACAWIASGFPSQCNSEAMKPFVEANLVQNVYERDIAIATAIRARGANEGEKE